MGGIFDLHDPCYVIFFSHLSAPFPNFINFCLNLIVNFGLRHPVRDVVVGDDVTKNKMSLSRAVWQ